MEEGNSPPQSVLTTKIIFILFGVASLLGWNALLTELSFFNEFLPSMNVFVSFGFLNYILNIGFQFLLMWKKNFLPLKIQLIIGIAGSIFFLIVLPMFTMILENDSFANKFITGLLVVLMGFINALCSGGFFNLVSNFPLEMIVSLSTGQGFSGIAMNILQYIVLILIPVSNEEEKRKIYSIRAWLFFGISSLILLVCLILLLIYYNTEYFQYYLNKSNSQKKDDPNTRLIEGETEPGEGENEEKEQKEEKANEEIVNNEENQEKEASFKYLFFKLWDLDLLMAYVYIVTFALFPNASINQNLFQLKSCYFDYNLNTNILIYNVFDTIGRYLVAKVKPTKKLNMIVILGRSILLFTMIFNYYCQDRLEWNNILTSILLIINMALLAATNGIGTTLCFGIAPNEVDDEYKGQSGNSLSFFLIVGIFLGACVAFGSDGIIGTFKNDGKYKCQ